MNITSELTYVTPDMAEKWLMRNTTNNRNLNKDRVAMYANDMKNGNWHVTGQGIQFDVNGTMIDGQHRLHAVIDSGMTIPMMVTKGLPVDAIDGIDTNMVRSINQIVKMGGATSLQSNRTVINAVNCYYKCVLGHGQVRVSVNEYKAMYKQLEPYLHTMVNVVKAGHGDSSTNRIKAATDAAILAALIAGVPEDELFKFADAYKHTRTGEERNKYPIKLAILSPRYANGSSQTALEELSEKYIYAFVNNLKHLPSGNVFYRDNLITIKEAN